MGRNKRSQQASDFPKQKRKPGKKIQKTNVTNTTFKAKPLTLLQQLGDKDPSELVTNSGQTLQDVLLKLNHPGEAIIIQGLEKLLILFIKRPEVIYANTAKIIAGVVRLIAFDNFTSPNFVTKLGKVLFKICTLPENIFMPYSNVFCSQIVFGLTSKKSSIQVLALKCVNQLFVSQKKSVSKNREVFKAFLRFLACDCVVGNQTLKVFTVAFNALLQFVLLFTLNNVEESKERCLTYKIHGDTYDVIDERPEITDPFEFKVCGLGNESDSPVSSVQGICTLFDAVFAFLTRIISTENLKQIDESTLIGIMNHLSKIVQNHLEKNVIKPGIYGKMLLNLANQCKLLDVLHVNQNMDMARWINKLSKL
uniref:Pre-rRNA-processing protein Ipi1 N-terminal domain-containing protein n=1 Tax=Panagrolaimus sp. JU765 TaxID=591449 RepID=A0AC34QN13_9BILA